MLIRQNFHYVKQQAESVIITDLLKQSTLVLQLQMMPESVVQKILHKASNLKAF